MENINISIKKAKTVPGHQSIRIETPFDNRFGFFGMVTEVCKKTNTVSVCMDTGRIISGVRVASFQWVTMDEEKDYLTGQRKLPPKDTFVYCVMPTGNPASAVVLCSVFAYQDSMGGKVSEFKEDTEDAVFTEKIIDNGGWKFTHDTRSGTRKIQNAPKDGDETISIEIDQEEEGEEKVFIKIHGQLLTLSKEKLDIVFDKCAFMSDGKKWTIDADGNQIVHDKSKTIISDNLEVSK